VATSQGDRHILVVDRDNWKLYELFAAYPSGAGSPVAEAHRRLPASVLFCAIRLNLTPSLVQPEV